MGSPTTNLFAFEVPTSAGMFRIVGPDTLPPDEAERIGAQIGRLIPLLVLAPLPDADDVLDALEGREPNIEDTQLDLGPDGTAYRVKENA